MVHLMSIKCNGTLAYMNHRILYLLFAFILPAGLLAQPTVTTGLTLEEYVNEILLGSGVEAFNITYTGSDVQLGYLENADDTDFPIANGLILSSAAATNFGPVDGACSGFGDVPFGEGASGDPDLLTIANSVPGQIGQNFNVSSVNDICVLEFDFVATGDTVKFNYAFGSDEYLEWVNSSFNDVFAFFLSGPGITGPYDSPAGFPDGAVNIAGVPGTDPPLPITVSSVNDVLNSEFYIDNVNNEGVCQDGYTISLEASYEVECGETYHIKLAIADGTDTALESIVVLEAGSFSSNSVVQVDLDIDVGGPDNDTMYEDCGEALLTFTRPIDTILEIEEMVVIEYIGEGVNGVDYTLLPDTVVFPPGVQTVSFAIDAFEDGIDEGIEQVQFEILNLAACNGASLTSYFEFFIADEPEPLVVEGYTTDVCVGAEEVLEPIISGGYGNFVYDWSTGETTPTITIEGTETETYNVIVGDTCGMLPDDADININILDFPPLEVSINGGDLTLGCNEFVNITATASGGDGFYTYSWQNQDGNGLGGFQNSLFYNSGQGVDQIIIEVTDGCNFIAYDTIDVELTIPELTVSLDPETTVLCGENFTVVPDVEGGQAPLFYNWYTDGVWSGFDSQFTTSTQEAITIMVEVSDNCGQFETATTDVIVESPPIELQTPAEVEGPCTEVFELVADLEGGSGGFQYTWDVNGEFFDDSQSIDFQSDANAVISISVVDQCGAADQATIDVIITNPPVEIELGEDINASCIDNTEFTVDVLNGSGGYEYNWSVADTAYSIEESIIVQSFQTIPITVTVTDGCGGSATDEAMYIIPDIPLDITVSADTAICAGDGISISALATGGEEGFSYFWPQLGNFGPDQYITPYNTNTYEVIATDICGETVSDAVTVEVQYLFSNFTVSNIEDNLYEFIAMPEPFCEECQFDWDLGDGTFSTEEQLQHEYDGLDNYLASLTVTNAIGCVDSTTTLILGPVILYVPNAFTPNNDGINDAFRVYGNGITQFEIIIFNRWGEVVYQSNDIEQFWNGSHQSGGHYVPDGMYSYVIKLKGQNTDAFERRGHINVMR